MKLFNYINFKLINESDRKTITVYHGTHTKHVEKIKKDGLVSNVGYYNAGWYMVSTDFESALFHATPIENGEVYVFEFEIPIVDGRWFGYPYLWKPYVRSDNSMWFALKEPIPAKYIKQVHEVKYQDWLEQKSLKY